MEQLSLGRQLKQARKDKGITLKDAADSLKIPIGELSDIEHDRRDPEPLLHVTMEALYGIQSKVVEEVTRTCLDCGKELYPEGSSVRCNSCNTRNRHRDRKNIKKIFDAIEGEQKIINIDFSSYEYEFKKIAESASKNVRTIEQQIIFDIRERYINKVIKDV